MLPVQKYRPRGTKPHRIPRDAKRQIDDDCESYRNEYGSLIYLVRVYVAAVDSHLFAFTRPSPQVLPISVQKFANGSCCMTHNTESNFIIVARVHTRNDHDTKTNIVNPIIMNSVTEDYESDSGDDDFISSVRYGKFGKWNDCGTGYRIRQAMFDKSIEVLNAYEDLNNGRVYINPRYTMTDGVEYHKGSELATSQSENKFKLGENGWVFKPDKDDDEEFKPDSSDESSGDESSGDESSGDEFSEDENARPLCHFKNKKRRRL